jgi:hypothetical protein
VSDRQQQRDKHGIESICELFVGTDNFIHPPSYMWRGLNDGTRIDFHRYPGLPITEAYVQVSKGSITVNANWTDIQAITQAVQEVREKHRAERWWVRLNDWIGCRRR